MLLFVQAFACIIFRRNKRILRIGVMAARCPLEAEIGVRVPDPQQFDCAHCHVTKFAECAHLSKRMRIPNFIIDFYSSTLQKALQIIPKLYCLQLNPFYLSILLYQRER